jgi:hypothetical protein
LDEKSQIQALDRTQPGLPLKKGRCGTMTHDYMRNGTTTLFAALNVLDGKVIGECHGRHRRQECLKFLLRLDAGFPPQLRLHLVMDNYGTHKEPHVQAWLKTHPRFVCHFVPTSSSWLNLVGMAAVTGFCDWDHCAGYAARLIPRPLKNGSAQGENMDDISDEKRLA